MPYLRDAAALIVSIVAVSICASFGALFGPGEWYANLEKPAWNPPNWLFGPVWTTLYLAMALSAWLVWRRRHSHDVRLALGLYGFQLVLNGIWTPLFFGLHLLGIATIEIVVLCFAIVATILSFWPISRFAALLLAPYLAWVSFASFLSFTLWRLNS